VNLATGTLVVGAAETDAGTDREVDLAAGLIEALGSTQRELPRSLRSGTRLGTNGHGSHFGPVLPAPDPPARKAGIGIANLKTAIPGR